MAGQRLSSRVPGPLAGFAAGYDIWLEGRGICRRAVRDRLWQLAYLSEWLDGQGLSARDLDRRCTEKHLAERRVAGCVDWVAPSSLRVPLEYLREIGAVPRRRSPRPGRSIVCSSTIASIWCSNGGSRQGPSRDVCAPHACSWRIESGAAVHWRSGSSSRLM
jgi:hypothetical protein